MPSSVARTSKGYFHDMDPYKLHATKAIAMKERSRVSKLSGAKRRNPRVSTFYTILQDARKNNPTKFGNVPQGPHTFPHHGLHQGIIEARAQNKFNLFSSVIPSPAQYEKRVDDEISATHVKRPRAQLAKDIFKKRHKRFSTLVTRSPRSELQDIALAHVVNKLLQMDPHGSYAYKGKGASKKALKGKGESRLKPLAQQIDLPSTHGFAFPAHATTRSTTLLTALGKVGVA